MAAGNPEMPDNILRSNDAHYKAGHLAFWPAENPHEYHEHPLYNHKVTVHCAASYTAIGDQRKMSKPS
jgi:hypothetical protein